MKVTSLYDLQALRRQRSLASVELVMGSFLAGNLPLYALRFALWSCAQNGRVSVDASSTLDSMNFVPGRWTFQMLTQLLCKAADGLGELAAWDLSARRMEFVRTTQPLADGPWSAAVMFSGHESERPLLDRCLQALSAQPELSQGGEIIVCGPQASRRFVDDATGIRYVSLETPSQAGRFLVGRKKNFAIVQATHERVLVCHTRMVLRPGCLAALPSEFDMVTPRVWVQGSRSDLAYLDLGFFHGNSIAIHSWRPQAPIHYDRNSWLRRLGNAYPYIDGGLFCVRRSLALQVPMSETVAWGEAEDAEWALRLLHGGRLLEISLEAHADSIVCKTPRYARWGDSRIYRGLSDLAQYAWAARSQLIPPSLASVYQRRKT